VNDHVPEANGKKAWTRLPAALPHPAEMFVSPFLQRQAPRALRDLVFAGIDDLGEVAGGDQCGSPAGSPPPVISSSSWIPLGDFSSVGRSDLVLPRPGRSVEPLRVVLALAMEKHPFQYRKGQVCFGRC
jgi:hypothetical protein